MKVFVIVIIALVVILGCCGGGIFFVYYAGTHMSGQAVQPQIEGTPAINTYIGAIDEVTLDWGTTSQQAESGNEGRLAFDVSGDKGSGLVIVQQGPQGLVPADWAILEIDGQSYVIFGNPPEDLGAQSVGEEATEPAPDEGTPPPAEETAGSEEGNGG